MKQARLDQLSDGIFAIIITLLAFEIKVPILPSPATNEELWLALSPLAPTFLAFVLSFAVLFTYWRAHHYVVSVYAKTIDVRLTSINAVFFFFLSLIPFSSRMIGDYGYTQLAIGVYAVNIIMIGLTLMWMRHHVLSADTIEHTSPSVEERRRGVMRTLVPVFCAGIAILISFWSTTFAIALLALAIIFNIFSRTTKVMNWLIERVAKDRWEVVPESEEIK